MTARGTGDLAVGLHALDTIVEIGPGLIDPRYVEEAHALRERVDRRLALGDGSTVVAVTGGTGVGKSALVNRIVGAPIATEGVRRPTTTEPLAVNDPATHGAEALLDWLEIDQRIEAPGGFPRGLVLVDLPDHDSVVDEHRATSARLARRVDALVIVVDPIKYARADLHHGPLADLTDHAEVALVVLNRVDELAEPDVSRCVEDLRERLAGEGHVGFEVLTTSAVTGAGIGELRRRIRALVDRRNATTRRLAADIAVLGDRVLGDLRTMSDPSLDIGALRDALMDATDAHRVIAEAEVAYRREGRRATRSPLSRALRLPLRAVTDVGRAFGIGETRAGPHVSSAPVARIESTLASILRLDDTTGRAHAFLGAKIEQLAAGGAPALVDAVDGVGVQPGSRRWWQVTSNLRGIVEAVALVGLVWLALLGVGDWLRLPEIPTPMLIGEVSWPTALLLGGIALRVATAAIVRPSLARGAERHRNRVAERVRERLDAVVSEQILEPYAEELARHRRLRDAVSAASARG